MPVVLCLIWFPIFQDRYYTSNTKTIGTWIKSWYSRRATATIEYQLYELLDLPVTWQRSLSIYPSDKSLSDLQNELRETSDQQDFRILRENKSDLFRTTLDGVVPAYRWNFHTMTKTWMKRSKEFKFLLYIIIMPILKNRINETTKIGLFRFIYWSNVSHMIWNSG